MNLKTKILFVVLVVIAVGIIILSLFFLNRIKQPAVENLTPTPGQPGTTSSQKRIPKEAIQRTIKALPEVSAYIKSQPEKSTFITTSENNANTWNVEVGTVVTNIPGQNHATAFNWYIIDKTTGKVKCSMYVYDTAGTFVRASGPNEFPCK